MLLLLKIGLLCLQIMDVDTAALQALCSFASDAILLAASEDISSPTTPGLMMDAIQLAGPLLANVELVEEGSPARRREAILQSLLPTAEPLAEALQQFWALPEQEAAARLEAAQAAARSCALLCCSNLGLEGGPAAGEGSGSLKCAACRSVWYCGAACSHADWRAGHKRVCKLLAAARQQARREQQQQRGPQEQP